MEEVFKYIIGLGAAVMMPVIFTVLGVCIGIKFGDALKAGLKVGVGFIGLSIVTALLTSALGPALDKVVDIYDLKLKVFDMGWPAAASVAYNTAVGAFIIPVCLGVNLLMLLTLLKKYGLRHIRFHDLRHTFASILIGQDVPLINVSNFLGHSDLSTTANIYAHLDKASKQA